jgi:hypothetical protein
MERSEIRDFNAQRFPDCATLHPGYDAFREAMMRTLTGLTVTLAMTLSAAPAQAQTYDPNFPVCMQVYTRGANFITCGYTSLEQCRATASGRSAMCMLNPYFAGTGRDRPRRRHRSNG